MRRCVFVFILLLGLVFCADTSFAEKSAGERTMSFPQVMGRGLVNILSTPFEVIRTPANEMKEHKYLWPITSLPRMFRNIIFRAASGVTDLTLYPFAAPFLDGDAPPLTEKMGISNYIWETEDEF